MDSKKNVLYTVYVYMCYIQYMCYIVSIIQQLVPVHKFDWLSGNPSLLIFPIAALGCFTVCITLFICLHHVKFHFLIRNGYYSSVSGIQCWVSNPLQITNYYFKIVF